MIRAAVFDGPGKPFRLQAVPRPALAPGEALVRVAMCTVCGSDLHTATGRRPGPTPCVLGHEVLGVVEESAGRVEDVLGDPLRAGDRVVVGVARGCGACYFCQRGLLQKCERLQKLGHEVLAPNRGPLGGLATHVHTPPGAVLVRVPEDIPDAVAAPVGCATATVSAAYRVCREFGFPQWQAPEVVAVVGLGMLGLTACALNAAGGATVIAVDVSEPRRTLAVRFGATHTASPAEAVELAVSLTAGRGADAAFEFSGSPDGARLAVEILRTGGMAVWAGAVLPTAAVPVDPERVVRRCLRVAGVHNYIPADLADAVRFLADHHARFPFAGLVSRTFPLDEVDAAFRTAERERPVRVAVTA